jgi:CheY-like chemotaxis protein
MRLGFTSLLLDPPRNGGFLFRTMGSESILNIRRRFLASSNVCIVINTAAPASDWPFASVWFSDTEDESGSSLKKAREQPSFSHSPSKTPTLRLNLLLVEDNLPDALIVREVIREHNLPFDVYAAIDGAEAVEFLANAERDPRAPSPDLVLLDLNIPKVDGFEVLRRIRASEKHAQVPVIIVSSSDSPADRNEAARFANGYFRKPADLWEFLKLGDVLKRFVIEKGLL